MFLYEKIPVVAPLRGDLRGLLRQGCAPGFGDRCRLPPESRVFTPGDGVTVSAEGFEADDEIMFEIHWEEGAEGVRPERLRQRRAGDRHGALRRERHLSGPGALPCFDGHGAAVPPGASDALGKIRVADGVPESEALYGISDSDTDKTVIDRIDLSTGGVTPIETLGAGRNHLRRGTSRFGLDLRRLFRFDGRFRPYDELL